MCVISPFSPLYAPIVKAKEIQGNKRGTKSTNKQDPMASNDAKVRMQTSGIRPIAQPVKRIEKARI